MNLIEHKHHILGVVGWREEQIISYKSVKISPISGQILKL